MTRPGRRQLIVGLLVLSLLGWAFAELADEVFEGSTEGFDKSVLRLFRKAGDPSTPIGPPWLHETARDMTALGGGPVLFLVGVTMFGILLFLGRRHMAWYLFLAVVSGALLSGLLKASFSRPRPDIVPHLAWVGTSSFPSGHSMSSAIVYLTIGAILASASRRWGYKVFVLSMAAFVAILVGLSRVFLGVHYPTDVLAGWSAGAAWATAAWLLLTWLQRRGKVESEG